ncbi:tRNA (adenosine(37)-N6)-threonylcarbamoyltransferase complex dimerization subunit type 1 TsaB [soil metagenome]
MMQAGPRTVVRGLRIRPPTLICVSITSPSPMLLAIETATDICSVALWIDDAVRAEANLVMPRRHAAELVPLVDNLMARAGCTPESINAVAVSLGPGSYTGLRIGLSTAKGLCLATGAKLVGVGTLPALGRAALPSLREGETVITALPSRRGEVYLAAFRLETDGLVEVLPPAAVSIDVLNSWFDERLDGPLVVGPASDVVLEVLADRGARPPAGPAPRSAAAHVAAIGADRLAAGDYDDPTSLEPLYLKPFISQQASVA